MRSTWSGIVAPDGLSIYRRRPVDFAARAPWRRSPRHSGCRRRQRFDRIRDRQRREYTFRARATGGHIASVIPISAPAGAHPCAIAGRYYEDDVIGEALRFATAPFCR